MGLIAQRALGVVLLAATLVPLHRLLDPDRAGPAGLATRTGADAAWGSGILGALIVLGLALAASRIVAGDRLEAPFARWSRFLERPSRIGFALGVGGVAFVLAIGSALWLHGGLPSSVDEMAQLLHARALSAGRLTVPTLGAPAAFSIQNGLSTPDGWVSIYPPAHTIALALGLAAGAPWMVGPVAIGVATALSSLSFERLLGLRTGRLAGALLSVTPFWILLGGTHLSHSTAAAWLALVLWTALRARESDRIGWFLATGAAVGGAVATRPWVGLVSATVLLAIVWLPWSAGGRGLAGGGRRLVALCIGGAPFAALLAWWNTRLFGRPFRLGYSAAFGPAHGLGLHTDPWGNEYGLVEALAYTGADLVQLGARLLETPLPAVAVIGAGLLLARSRAIGPVFVAWAVAALGANAAYWHHGVHLGPRMLFESTPAWIGLFVATAGVVASRRLGAGMATWCVALTVLGGVILAPATARDLARSGASEQPPVPVVPGGGPALIFAHGSWASRIAARLEATGMRRDSIETALRRNDVCAVDRYARWRSEARGAPPPLDLEALPGTPPTLQTRVLSPGNPVRVAVDGPRDSGCAREAGADRFGVMELEPLLWRAPPTATVGVVLVRDLGPAANADLSALADRPWYVYLAGDGRGGPRLLAYEDGMELLWRGATTAPLR